MQLKKSRNMEQYEPNLGTQSQKKRERNPPKKPTITGTERGPKKRTEGGATGNYRTEKRTQSRIWRSKERRQGCRRSDIPNESNTWAHQQEKVQRQLDVNRKIGLNMCKIHQCIVEQLQERNSEPSQPLQVEQRQMLPPIVPPADAAPPKAWPKNKKISYRYKSRRRKQPQKQAQGV